MCRSLAGLIGLVVLLVPWSPGASRWMVVHAQETRPAPQERLDLNTATLEELRELPIPVELADAIYEYRQTFGIFESFYDLADVEGMTAEALAALRDLVATVPPPERDEALARYDESFRQIERFLSDEGAREELADEYMDQLRQPRDINDMSLYELMAMQNVSPVDAVAIIKARDRLGRIEDDRQLRSIDGLSYWAYRNIRDFVVYDKPQDDGKLHGDLQFVSFSTPYSRGGDEQDIFDNAFLSSALRARDFFTNANPAVLTKARLRLGRQLKGGFMTYRQVAEQDLTETVKGYVAIEPESDASLRVDRAIVGNYRLAFGQGLVMDNTDFFLPRKTGHGWNKRPGTVIGDVARSYEFTLRGGALQFTAGPLQGTGFFSHDTKDGVVNLNSDGSTESINRYIVLRPRLDQSVLDATNEGLTAAIRRDAFTEDLIGGNLRLGLWPGTYVGVTGYEARTDKPIDPKVLPLFDRPDLLQARDSEIFADYSSVDIGNFRRVVGTEFQAVYENVALQGEYAKLDSNPSGGLFSSAPEAFLINGYVQYGDLNLLAIYRDYDLGFDNPYARGFSNDTRYEQTLLGDPFRLSNDLFAFLSAETPQMKPERGLFLSTRYRISRKLTITGLDFDQWTRVADGQDMRRYTLRMEYAPIWPLRFRLRQRFSSRGEQILEDTRRFKSWDTRIETILRLSGYDELRFLYSSTSTQFAPRPRLSELPEGGVSPQPQAGSPGQAIQAQLRHNVNPNLMLMFSTLMYDGFLWNFEDNEFVLLDGRGFRNWALVRSRISEHLLLRFKVTNDRQVGRSSILYGREIPNQPPGNDVRLQDTAFRLQLDYTF
jgi:DNA uptake protein ComE-like DNA-binding protein